MSEAEVEVVEAVAPAPDQVATAAPEPEVKTPEAEPTKTFTQEEVDALIGKRLAREQRKWERERSQPAPSSVETPKDLPPADQFESVEAYADALATRKAEELLAQREAKRAAMETEQAFNDRVEAAMEKYDDFDAVVFNNRNLPITEVMAQTIKMSEQGPDVAYYLGTNPAEAARISKLAPYLQAKEIGRIEVALSTNPPVKKTSSAPAPIKPVTAASIGVPAYDTTDPRSVKSMSTSEWIEAERQRQIRKWESQRR
jgi:hypothetical protein